MNIKEVLESGKLARREISGPNAAFGNIIDLGSKIVFASNGPEGAYHLPLSIDDLMAGDWELQHEARTFFLGLAEIQSHDKVVKIMKAVTTADNKPPSHRTADGKSWIKVVEVLE